MLCSATTLPKFYLKRFGEVRADQTGEDALTHFNFCHNLHPPCFFLFLFLHFSYSFVQKLSFLTDPTYNQPYPGFLVQSHNFQLTKLHSQNQVGRSDFFN